MRYLRRFPILLLLSSTALILRGEASDDDAPRPRYPDQDIGADTLPARKMAQRKTVNQFKVFYQFQFTDKLMAFADYSATTHAMRHSDRAWLDAVGLP